MFSFLWDLDGRLFFFFFFFFFFFSTRTYQADRLVLGDPLGTLQSGQLDQEAQPTTLPPAFSTSRQQASTVPPVANRSSTTSTFEPGAMASVWISRVSLPYSRS